MGSTLFIVWRESVEAMLVVGILHSWLKFNAAGAAGQRALGLGVISGIGLAGLLGWIMVAAQDELSGAALEWFQTGMLMVAAGLIAQMVLWMRRHGAGMRKTLHQDLSTAMQRSGLWGIATVAALAIAREGAETAVFLYGVSLEPGAGPFNVVLGALLGVGYCGASPPGLLGAGPAFSGLPALLPALSGWMLLLFARGAAGQRGGPADWRGPAAGVGGPGVEQRPGCWTTATWRGLGAGRAWWATGRGLR
jgi:high-affinity iron transporter